MDERGLGGDPVAAWARDLRTIDRRSRLAWAAEVGRRAVELVGEGTSLAEVARHPDLPMSEAQLYRCVATHRLLSAIPSQQWTHVGVCHVRAVTGLPGATQADWLVQAERNRWTVRELSERVAGARSRAARRGPPRQPPALRTLREIVRLADRGRAFEDLDPIALDARERVVLRRAVDRLALEFDMLRRRL